MFSQYSWWDFAKFVLVLAVPYYAFVLWKYYREDIREWISNRGQPQPELVTQETDDQDYTSSSLFQVTDYTKLNQVEEKEDTALSNWLRTPVPTQSVDTQQVQNNPVKYPLEEADLRGPALNENTNVAFGLPISVVPDNVSEQSINEAISASQRLTKDENGLVTPIDADDKPAVKLAGAINNQQSKAAFSDFSFSR